MPEVAQMINNNRTSTPLLDHVEKSIVNLDPDHPGFRDKEYARGATQSSEIALTYKPGSPIPTAPIPTSNTVSGARS